MSDKNPSDGQTKGSTHPLLLIDQIANYEEPKPEPKSAQDIVNNHDPAELGVRHQHRYGNIYRDGRVVGMKCNGCPKKRKVKRGSRNLRRVIDPATGKTRMVIPFKKIDVE